MLIDNIDITKKHEFVLTLTMTNKKELAILKDIINPQLEVNMDTQNRLSFEVPYFIEEPFTFSHEWVYNTDYDLIKVKNLIRLNNEQYFVINNVTLASGEKSNKKIECVSLENKLSKKNIVLNGIERQLHSDELHVGQGIFDILEEETSWSMGVLDHNAKYETINNSEVVKYRWFDSINKSWYDFLTNDVTEAFNVILFFDTINKKIDVYDRNTFGENKGLYLSEENWIKNISKTIRGENIVTRLHISGREDIEISTVNPNGKNYIECFDYVKLNGQMSEELIEALEKYNILLNQKNAEFQTLKSGLDSLVNQRTIKQGQMLDVQEEITGLEHLQAAYIKEKNNTDLPTVKANIQTKKTELANIQTELNNLQTQINTKNSEIAQIASDIEKENSLDEQGNNIFSEDLLEELDDFIEEDYWSNNNYLTPETLYNAGYEILLDRNTPPVEFDMDIVSFLDCAEGVDEREKLVLGDLVYAYSSKTQTDEEVRIVGYTYAPQSNSLKISFSNKRKKTDDNRTIANIINSVNNTKKTVDLSKFMWDKSSDNNNWIENFRNAALDVAKQNVVGQVGKNKFNMSERGIFVIDASNENYQIAITSSTIAFTTDAWSSARTAIDENGIYANYLVGKVILGEQLFVGNNDGTVELTGLGMTIKDQNGNLKVKIGKLDNGNYGITIYGASGNVVLSEEGMLQTLPYLREDNLDSSNPLLFLVNLPPSTISVRSAKLSFLRLPFRAYEKAAKSGGNGTKTSDASSKTTTDDGGASYSILSSGIRGDLTDLVGTYNSTARDGDHYHTFTMAAIDHTHDFSTDDHSHGMSHTHNVQLPGHTHPLDFGIFTDTLPTNTDIYIDGVLRIDGNYNGDTMNVDITEWIQTGGIHRIELTSESLGRLHCSLIIECFVTT